MSRMPEDFITEVFYPNQQQKLQIKQLSSHVLKVIKRCDVGMFLTYYTLKLMVEEFEVANGIIDSEIGQIDSAAQGSAAQQDMEDKNGNKR